MKKFDESTYWQHRVSGKMGLGAVGHRSLGINYNAWIYRRRLDVLDTLLATQFKNSPELTVLDLGCGSGFYESYWRSHGITELRGLDVSVENIALLKKEYPEFEFCVVDITEPASESARKFKIVTIFDVLYHLVDDSAASRALAYAATCLDKEGRLLIFDQFCSRDYQLRKHVKFRGKDKAVRMLAAHGLEIEREIPLFVILEPPIYGWRVLDLPIAAIYYSAGAAFRLIPPLGSLAGSIVFSFDSFLRRYRIETPNHCLYVIRHVTNQ